MARKKQNTGLIVVALLVLVAWAVLATLDVTGNFSVIGGNPEDDSGDEPFPQDSCAVFDEVTSVRTAAAELGWEEYSRITSTDSLVEVDGVVYRC